MVKKMGDFRMLGAEEKYYFTFANMMGGDIGRTMHNEESALINASQVVAGR